MSLKLRPFMPATTRAKRKTNLVRMCNDSVSFEKQFLSIKYGRQVINHYGYLRLFVHRVRQ